MHAVRFDSSEHVNHEQDLNLLDEQAMVERAQQDRAHFRPIYDLYAAPVYRLCLRATGDPDLADDLTAKVFLSVLERIHKYKSKPGSSFKSWLFVVARNTVRDHWRKNSRVHRLFDTREEVADGDAGPEELAIHRIQLEDLRLALETLNERQRTIVELRLSGLTTNEIAKAMGITVAALKSAQTRAYANIRRELEFKGGSQ